MTFILNRVLKSLFFVLIASFAFAANFTLDIISPDDTAGMPATHRVFHAYPNIEYNIRIAVHGGLYPFTFALNQPATTCDNTNAITLDADTGEISWTPQVGDTGCTISVTVTDDESSTDTTSWVVTVGTANFVFVADLDDTGGAGTIADPYKSLADLFAGTSNADGKIVYFRTGTYPLIALGTQGGDTGQMNLSDPNQELATWLEYPGETVVMDGGGTIEVRNYNSAPYVDGITFQNFDHHAFNGQGTIDYQLWRRCVFDDLVTSSSVNLNQGYLYFNGGDSVQGKYTVIQDNEFKNWAGGSAIGSLYSTHYALIEDNYVHDDTAGGGAVGWILGLTPKINTDYLSIRHNRVIMDNGRIMGHGTNSFWSYTDMVDISFNFFKNNSSEYGIAVHNRDSITNNGETNEYVYRNTIVGHFVITKMDGSSCGSYGDMDVEDNVIVSEGLSTVEGDSMTITGNIAYRTAFTPNSPENCVTNTGNLYVDSADSAIDTNGLLQGAYRTTYLGTTGWETTATPAPVPEVPANAIQGMQISNLNVTENLTAWNRTDNLR